MTLTNDNLFSEPYNQIKSFLEGINSLDPRNRYKANWIHASLPNINQKGFDGYPFIVLKVDVNEEENSVDNSVSIKVFRIMIGVYSDDASQVDTISDAIYSNLKSSLTEFKNKGLSSSPISWDLDMSGKKISFRNIGIIARRRL